MHRVLLVVIAMGCSRGSHPEDTPAAPVQTPAQPKAVADAALAVVDAAPAAPPDAAVPKPAIVDAPMAWSDERARLTLDYRQRHSDADAKDLDIAPRVIVLHYTGGSSAKSTREYFDNVRIEAERKDVAAAGAVNVSSHFVIDRDGTIYQIQPETRFARHCIGLNHIAIGIENAGDVDYGGKGKYPLTDAQVAANVALVRYLASKYPITHLLGHYEVMGFKKNAYYRERDPKYANDKPDPGPTFMKKVRAELGDVPLSGASSGKP